VKLGIRFWWLAILLAAPVPLAACDSGGEESSPTNTVSAEVLPPEGFSASPDGFSVVLSWSAPTNSARIVGYELSRDGRFLESIEPEGTTFTDFDVKPGRSYSYAMRSKGQGMTSEPVATDVKIRIPPIKAARLEGDFDVHAKVKSQTGYESFGGPTSFAWVFRAKCREGPCDVVWKDLIDKRIHARLNEKRGTYTGDYKGIYLSRCRGSRSISSVHLVLKIVKARAVGGVWRATRIEGTLTNSETPQFGCVSAKAVQTLKGRLRPDL
jgi:hypothetical protein